MDDSRLSEQLCPDKQVPEKVEIRAVRQRSREENARRLRELLTIIGETNEQNYDRGDWLHQDDRILVRLPHSGRAEVYHASGAMRVLSGTAPMEQLFPSDDSREDLQRLIEKVADRLHLTNWIAKHETLDFERLWLIKAAAAGRDGKTAKPVLCRAVGAFRHSVGVLPVLGGASLAIKIAAKGAIDMVAIQLLETDPEPVDTVAVLGPEEAARDIERQLQSLMGGRACPQKQLTVQPLRLGYLHLGRRKAQHLLAPHYVTTIRVTGEEVQAYQLATPATELLYQPLCLSGHYRGSHQRRAA